mmetsp:Transcript_82116/g.254932  ORF Transcript_82116/g.254932 Transcript_82116/m.254932 type:complete len:469 (+) Transcript_82116:410-1816(+)
MARSSPERRSLSPCACLVGRSRRDGRSPFGACSSPPLLRREGAAWWWCRELAPSLLAASLLLTSLPLPCREDRLSLDFTSPILEVAASTAECRLRWLVEEPAAPACAVEVWASWAATFRWALLRSASIAAPSKSCRASEGAGADPTAVDATRLVAEPEAEPVKALVAETEPAATAARQRCSSSTPMGSPSMSSSAAPAGGALVEEATPLRLSSSDMSIGSPSTSSSGCSGCMGGGGARAAPAAMLAHEVAAAADAALLPEGGAVAAWASAGDMGSPSRGSRPRWLLLASALPSLGDWRAQYSSNARSRQSNADLVGDSSGPPPATRPRFLQWRSSATKSMEAYASSLDCTAGSSQRKPPCPATLKAAATSAFAKRRFPGAACCPAPDVASACEAARAPPKTTASRPFRKSKGKTSRSCQTLSSRRMAGSAERRAARAAEPLWPSPPLASALMASRNLAIMPGSASWKA